MPQNTFFLQVIFSFRACINDCIMEWNRSCYLWEWHTFLIISKIIKHWRQAPKLWPICVCPWQLPKECLFLAKPLWFLIHLSCFLCLWLPTDKRDMTSYNMLLKAHVICAIQIYKIPPFYTEKHIIEHITVFIILCQPFPLILPSEWNSGPSPQLFHLFWACTRSILLKLTTTTESRQ